MTRATAKLPVAAVAVPQPPSSGIRIPLRAIWGAAGLVIGLVIAVALIQLLGHPLFLAPLDQPMAHSDLPALFRQFRCPCCEQNIGECTCPQAAERRDLLTERVTLGDSRRDIYELMLLRDGPRAFFDPASAEQASTWLARRMPDARPVLVIDEQEIDLGTIRMADGPASARFTLRNDGLAPLTITGLSTSCMCTTALLETASGPGPTFGAHADQNPVGWSATLQPGEAATLVVTFDPNAHGPDAVGDFMREVTISSDDPLQPQVVVRISMTVIR